jgi:hypothetical protein
MAVDLRQAETYLRTQRFLSSDKSELGIFWMDDALSEVIHYKTVLEEDIDLKNPSTYSFQHYNEWSSRPEGIPGSYTDYPRGRIFFQDNKYYVEINVPVSLQAESYIKKFFTLPGNTEVKTGYW